MSSDPQDDARIELLARLEHFAPQPRTVLDLGGAVTGADDDVLRRRFSQARIILSRRAPGTSIAGVAHGAQATSLVGRLQHWWQRLVRSGVAPLERITAEPDALPLPDGSVDLILGHWLMPGMGSLDAVLAELRRCLVPGGLFLWTSAGAMPGEPSIPEAIDMHVLGSALSRAGFIEAVLDVDRYVAARLEVVHAAAFAGEVVRTMPDEVLLPLDSLQRRRKSIPMPPPGQSS
jgi:SAM-dependent methyltransferase